MAGYKQTEVGVIPEDWNVKTVGQIAEVKTGPFGSTLHEKDYVANGTPIITVEHLGERGIYHFNLPMVSDVDRVRLKGYSIRSGDLVFSRVGSVDRNALVKKEENGWLFSGRLLRVRLKNKDIDPHYLSFHFHSESFKQRVRDVAVGQTMASLNTKILMGVSAIIPPTKAEQEAIAGALSDTDALIESLEQLITKKRHIKQGAMQELLTGRKRLPGFCGEWEMKRLGDVIEKFVGGGTPSRSSPQYWGDEIPWVTVKDFTTFDPWNSQEMITRLGLKHSASHLIPKGILITSTRMALGKAVVYKVDVAINQDLKALSPKPILATRYLYFWFQYHGQSIDELGSGSTVKGISLPDLRKIQFQLPSCPEQTAIASILSDMDAEIAALETKLNKTRSIKQGMMHELLTGKTRLL